MMSQTAIIIGAGPAGLTAAYELLNKSDILPIVFEMDTIVGGISKTVNYKKNKIDIGGHRFFSKSKKINEWWLNILPLENDFILSPKNTDDVMLLRLRLSRILFSRKFFDYPISISCNTISNLGFINICKIVLSYIKACIFKRNEKSLEDFFINRFGYELYSKFFKDYTRKVWGVPCSEIKPEWGKQRIKGLSVSKTIKNAIKKIFIKDKGSLDQPETSLIDKFMYPKLGSGYMWEKVTNSIKSQGGVINLNQKVVKINTSDDKITSIIVQNNLTGEIKEHAADYFISSMPLKDLVEGMNNNLPEKVKCVAQGLKYRDFITVGVLFDKLRIEPIYDNWIYVQEMDVKLGRIQVFNNWSPYLVADPNNTWLGLEYFCNIGDELWNMSDDEISSFAVEELTKIGIVNSQDVLDSVVIRMQKAYPAYFGSYEKIDIVKSFLDSFDNLFLIGRNGMHRYNNMDHSMLSAMQAVDNIINNYEDKSKIWQINTEEDYH